MTTHTCIRTSTWSDGEARLVRFGLEQINEPPIIEGPEAKQETTSSDASNANARREKAQQRRQAEGRDEKIDQKKMQDIERKMDQGDAMIDVAKRGKFIDSLGKLAVKHEPALSSWKSQNEDMQNLRETFQQEFKAMVKTMGIADCTVNVTGGTRAGADIEVKGKDGKLLMSAFFRWGEEKLESVKWGQEK